ncbi:VOC family protein [Zavarzinia compransoris]|uniref:Extradiol ring-cleavage dioxygenase n=1 Tax=Zavarzinia compransoris TaxID=1264899 RepID=A0A317DZI9_9PROT|nr:VOC family protein [Zavarzinia compransoris]PWR18305.1 extradiol ring-cleavage dioxygenase [Zavarzinia compransoris]TDP43638.1 2,3-dihydroxybiphenyl 1,2-dioxygenase [Zavarzinia compransoris]
MSNATDIFGAVGMGYVIVESERLADWRRFLKQGLGLHEAAADDDALAFRVDTHARRFMVRRGKAEDVTASGWQVRDEATLAIIRQRLADRGIAIETGSAEEAEFRGVTSFIRVKGPKDMAIELFTDALPADEPLRMLTGGFVTGASGLGHFAITSKKPEKMLRFWQEIFDARLSDRIAQPMAGIVLDITFLRLNERHHSIAVATTRGLRLDPIRTRIQHMNLLVETLEDLSAAFERLTDLGYEMAHEIGQHPNDREVSFYVLSPSGFEMELGWNALRVDEATWKQGYYNAISVWGHKPERNSPVDRLLLNLGNFRRGLGSLLSPEYSPL